MSTLRLLLQSWLSAVAIPLGLNHKLGQFCDRCGRTGWRMAWWDDTNKVWEAVAGNVNGHRHGCYCPQCFTALAREKGIRLLWVPTVNQ